MKLKHLLFSSLLLSVYAGAAHAEPKSGFGLQGGFASHSMSGTITAGAMTGQPLSYSSSGLSLGIDYQIALTPNFSINPFLQSSGESTSGNLVPGVTAGHGILGLQLRYWAGDMYFGGHVGSYSEVLNNPNTGLSTNATGNGYGLVMGWEDWQALADRLNRAGMDFLIAPYLRYAGTSGEQATMFFLDPSGNALEFKAFHDDRHIFTPWESGEAGR